MLKAFRQATPAAMDETKDARRERKNDLPNKLGVFAARTLVWAHHHTSLELAIGQ
jgi:hypothetical protein